jgi:hypothetical protein
MQLFQLMSSSVIVLALLLSAQVTASHFAASIGTLTAQGDALVDRSQSPYFNSGGNAPQYVQLQLAGTYNISNVCLLTHQTPNGFTSHLLLVGSNESSLEVVSNLTGYTITGQWINISYNPVLTDIQFLRLYTVTSPSWVAWQKFLVYGS